MVKEKLSQQKHEMYSLYLQHKDEEEEPKDGKKADDKKEKKTPPANVYG